MCIMHTTIPEATYVHAFYYSPTDYELETLMLKSILESC